MRGWNVWIALFTSILKCTFKIEYNSIEMYINIKLPKAIYTIAWVYKVKKTLSKQDIPGELIDQQDL